MKTQQHQCLQGLALRTRLTWNCFPQARSQSQSKAKERNVQTTTKYSGMTSGTDRAGTDDDPDGEGSDDMDREN